MGSFWALFWHHFGPKWGPFWGNFGALFGGPSGPISSQNTRKTKGFWTFQGRDLIPFWGHFGTHFRPHFGPILVPFWDHFWVTFWLHFGQGHGKSGKFTEIHREINGNLRESGKLEKIFQLPIRTEKLSGRFSRISMRKLSPLKIF